MLQPDQGILNCALSHHKISNLVYYYLRFCLLWLCLVDAEIYFHQSNTFFPILWTFWELVKIQASCRPNIWPQWQWFIFLSFNMRICYCYCRSASLYCRLSLALDNHATDGGGVSHWLGNLGLGWARLCDSSASNSQANN